MRIRRTPLVAALTTLSAFGLLAAGTPALAAAPEHDLGACSPAVSLRGYTDALDKSTFAGQQVGGLSSMAMDGSHVLAVADHPSELYTLSVHSSPGHLDAKVDSHLTLADEQGKVLDAEGLAVDSDGTRLVSSEIEPSVRRYDRAGHILERLPVPDRFRTTPAGQAQVNLSFEGLTLLPGNRSLIATMEGPLTTDKPDAAGRSLLRFVRWDKDRAGHFKLARQYAYAADKDLYISEARAISPARLLILERGFKAGYGNTIRIYLADLPGASDVTGVASLPAPKVRLVHKTLLADLARCPSAGAVAHQPQPNPLLDNLEDMTLTGRWLPGGRQELLLGSDDNLSAQQVTRLYSLSVKLPLV